MRIFPALVGAFLVTASPLAWAHHATMVEVGDTAKVAGVRTFCSGVGIEARDAAMSGANGVRIEITGRDGQYLGDQFVRITGGELRGEFMVHCDGPWLVADLPAGIYAVKTWAGHEGPSKTVIAHVDGRENQRVVVNFPELGGTPEQKMSAME